jgi:hypothetical protein
MSQWMMPKVPQKYRIVCDVTGYSPKSIKTEVKNHMLTIHGKEDVKLEGGDFSSKEFKKTYEMPVGAITDKMVSFVTGQGQLVVEVRFLCDLKKVLFTILLINHFLDAIERDNDTSGLGLISKDN